MKIEFLWPPYCFEMDNAQNQKQDQKCLLVTRQNDIYSPGPGPGRLVLHCSSHRRSVLSNTIIGTFSSGDKRVWKYIPRPNGLGEGESYTYKYNVSVLAMGTRYAIEWWFLQRLTTGIRASVGILALPFWPLYNNMGLLSPLRFLRDSHFKCSTMPVVLPVL